MTGAICKNCGHGRNGHVDRWGGICVGCPCPGFEAKDAAESLPAEPEHKVMPCLNVGCDKELSHGGDCDYERYEPVVNEKDKGLCINIVPGNMANIVWGGPGPEPSCTCGNLITKCTKMHDDHYPPKYPPAEPKPTPVDHQDDYCPGCHYVNRNHRRDCPTNKPQPDSSSIPAGDLVERIAVYVESESECLMPIVVEETKRDYGVRLLKVMADEIRHKFAAKGQSDGR